MEKELVAIQKNETWEIVGLPKEKTLIGLKWVFWTKYLVVDGSIQKYRA